MRILLTVFLVAVFLVGCKHADNKIEPEDLYDSPDEAISSYFSKNNVISAIGYNIHSKIILLVEEGVEAYSIAELIKNQDNRYALVRRGNSVQISNATGATWSFSGMDSTPYRVNIKKQGYKDNQNAVFHKEMGLYIVMEVKESEQYVASEDYEVLKSK